MYFNSASHYRVYIIAVMSRAAFSTVNPECPLRLVVARFHGRVTVGTLTVAGVTVYHKIAGEENLNQQ
jgi:hypothetical protein